MQTFTTAAAAAAAISSTTDTTRNSNRLQSQVSTSRSSWNPSERDDTVGSMPPDSTSTAPPPNNRAPFQKYASARDVKSPELDLEAGQGQSSSPLPRLVLRNRPFQQSANKVHIQHNQGLRIYRLLKHNWFHAFLRWPTSRSLLFLMSIWTSAILVFAGIYVKYDNIEPTQSCGLGMAGSPIEFSGAFAFSLETCTTVGYALPNFTNTFFEPQCGLLMFIIYLQMTWSMVFNACLLAFLYARLGRSETRSNQVICSAKALVSLVNGQVRFQVRFFDADAKHPVVEAHVRMYCVTNQRPVPRQMRVLQPDDDLGGMLFLSFPTVISHHIDLYSLLHPPTAATFYMTPIGMNLRQADGTTGNRTDVVCPICGESYGAIEYLFNHIRYNQLLERKDGWRVEGAHLSLNMDEIERQTDIRPTTNVEELKEYFRQNVSEVICVVEGIDPLSSGTFQSLQSYRFADIVWDARSQFAPCLTVVKGPETMPTGGGIFQVDLDRYHDIVPDRTQIQEAMAASEAAPPMTKRRRVKTVSSRPGDSLFSPSQASNNPRTPPPVTHSV